LRAIFHSRGPFFLTVPFPPQLERGTPPPPCWSNFSFFLRKAFFFFPPQSNSLTHPISSSSFHYRCLPLLPSAWFVRLRPQLKPRLSLYFRIWLLCGFLVVFFRFPFFRCTQLCAGASSSPPFTPAVFSVLSSLRGHVFCRSFIRVITVFTLLGFSVFFFFSKVFFSFFPFPPFFVSLSSVSFLTFWPSPSPLFQPLSAILPYVGGLFPSGRLFISSSPSPRIYVRLVPEPLRALVGDATLFSKFLFYFA